MDDTINHCTDTGMNWNTETRYKLLLEINNAIATKKSREGLFASLAKELHRYFKYDRLSIILYDSDRQIITYFAAADGIQPGGVIAHKSRPLTNGAVARIAINSKQPAIFDDLRKYTDLRSVGELVKAGLTSTMVFPLIVRDRVLGTIHFSYREKPSALTELTEVLIDTSQQIAIAVDNMLAYNMLKYSNQHLQGEKEYLLANARETGRADFFYASRNMQQVMDVLRQVAATDETILITGETGTGKDYLARLIHEMSGRGDHLFIKTNCPGLTASLFESELFGHARGAFTGAEKARMGRFELADKGTIFLDEIGELPIAQQAKLLQVLQEGKFERVGESSSIPVDARIVAATNKDLRAGVEDGWFRNDLFYRLETVTITVPPLRERAEDIPLLIENINTREAADMHRSAPRYTSDALDMLMNHAWPGNVRELKNMVKRFIILQPGATIHADDITAMFPLPSQSPHQGIPTLDEAERGHIVRALTATRGIVGGKKGAAGLLGMPRSTLQYRIKKLGIQPTEYSHTRGA
ncbi:MAG: sigma 54-interacting transcriptional regulator [Desulfofustis sp. PB-SRB1]|nr:sigma 54-interacting transcriptional regulator [Desulfofustis sp. PB-SRB1]MBM1003454.1 sigma 54-interacting transcriptional regulator [Desulfofustis sp. PB-SRB1]HBH27735.1 Fis family transcriptional regulator [Desulfofustis sp.]